MGCNKAMAAEQRKLVRARDGSRESLPKKLFSLLL